ncbi:MAG TPA: hypothetical protein VGK52_05415 [Polyangia bacterium]|jgi:hypothetical protein
MSETGGSLGGKRFEGPGGTPGGLGEALGGLAMIASGVYLVFSHVTVHTSFWRFLGTPGQSFGLTLLPLLVGIGALFFNGSLRLGWVLLVGGVLLILAGILMNLDIYFQPTSLWNTIFMFGLIGGGVGLFARGLRAH